MGKRHVELKVEGAPQRDRWDRAVLPSLLGGCFLKGAERKDPDELARSLLEAVKPKLYAYEGYADEGGHLRTPRGASAPLVSFYSPFPVAFHPAMAARS